MQVITTMVSFTTLTTAFAIPDAATKGSSSITQHVVVGTPSTLSDMVWLGTQHIKIFVVDEADNMLDQQRLGEQTLLVKK